MIDEEGYEYGEIGEFTKELSPELQEKINKDRQKILKKSTKDNKVTLNNIDVLYSDISQSNVSTPENIPIGIIEDSKDVKTIKTDKHWQFKKGEVRNPLGRPKKEKKSISSVIEAKLNDEKLQPDKYEMHKFVDRLFNLFYDSSGKSPMTAGSEILNRYDGKVKDVLHIQAVIDTIPDQKEQLTMIDRFRMDHKPVKIGEITG